VPWGGEEHFMLALIAERGEIVPPRAQAMLSALNPAIRAAVARLGLPLVAHASIFAQIVEEQSLGYACVALGGAVLETNRRAQELAMRYRAAAGIDGRRRALAEIAAMARARAGGGRTWRLEAQGPPAVLEVNAHRLAKETHALREDIILVMMRESLAPPSGAASSDPLARLTSRQQEVAILVARTGLSYKQIADRLGVSEATVYKHMENVHRVLGVRSRAELAVLLR
jgi:DNA-binding NarL/FixJ family response regulator